MGTRRRLLLLSFFGAFAACRAAPEDDSLAIQQGHDLASGYKRTSTAPAHFLVENGKGSLAETNGYYAQIIQDFVPDTFTLSTWQSQFITGKRGTPRAPSTSLGGGSDQ
jgi:hypothetical protein